MKNIYQKTYEKTYENYVYAWRNNLICPHCRRGLMKEHERWEDISFDDPLLSVKAEKAFQTEEYQCPKCGYRFGIYGSNAESEKDDDLPLYNTRHYETSELISESIHYDHERKRLILFLSFLTITPTQNGLIYKQYFEKWLVDMKNNTSYFYAPRKKVRRIINTTNQFGCTYSSCLDALKLASNTALAKMLKYVCVLKGVGSLYKEIIHSVSRNALGRDVCSEVFCIERRSFAEDIFHVINVLNRIPNILIRYDSYKNKYEYIQDKIGSTMYIISDFAKKSPHDIIDHNLYIEYMTKQCNLPKTKAFRKLYLENPSIASEIMFFKKCGFKNNDNLLSLIRGARFYLFQYEYAGVQVNERRLSTIAQIIKRMLKVTPENQVVKKINSFDDCNRYEFEDMINMYENLKRIKKEYLKMVNWHGTFIDIHDDLSKLVTKIEYENQEIHYDEKDYKLIEQIDDYSFDLAKDTNQLVEIGQKMGICVGGYRNVALSGYSKIIHVKNEDKYVGCIELSKEYSLRQAKAKYNNMMTGDLAEAFKKWVKKKSIKNLENCSDYNRLGQETQNTRDWHQFELDEEGNVVRAGQRERQNIEPQRNIHVEDEEGWYDEMPFF